MCTMQSAAKGEGLALTNASRVHACRPGTITRLRVCSLCSGARVAIKALSKQEALKLSMVDRVLQEVAIHSVVKHEHVVPCLDFFEDADCVYLVLHPCSNGNMFQWMKHNGTLGIDAVRHFGIHLFKALAYLHTLGILHRDLKLSNLLLDTLPDSANLKWPANLTLQLCDFGLAVRTTGDSEHRTVCGTPVYQAPEVRSGSVDGQATEPHTYATDVYSAGCLLYSMLVGRPPLETPVDDTGEPMNPHARARLSSDYQHNVDRIHSLSPDAAQLIRWCMADMPAARPTAATVLQHAFFAPSGVQTRVPDPVSPRAHDQSDHDVSSRVLKGKGHSVIAAQQVSSTGMEVRKTQTAKKHVSSKLALMSPPLTPIQARAFLLPPEAAQPVSAATDHARSAWPEMSLIQSRTAVKLVQEQPRTDGSRQSGHEVQAVKAAVLSSRHNSTRMNTSSFSTASTVAGLDNNTVLTFSGSHVSDTVVQSTGGPTVSPSPDARRPGVHDRSLHQNETTNVDGAPEVTGEAQAATADAYPRVLTPELDRVDDWDKEDGQPALLVTAAATATQTSSAGDQRPSPTPSPYDPMCYAAVNITPVSHHGGRQAVLVPSPEWADGRVYTTLDEKKASPSTAHAQHSVATPPQCPPSAAHAGASVALESSMAVTPPTAATLTKESTSLPSSARTSSAVSSHEGRLELVPPPVVLHAHVHSDNGRSSSVQGSLRYRERMSAASSSSISTTWAGGAVSNKNEADNDGLVEGRSKADTAGSSTLRLASTGLSTPLAAAHLQLVPSPYMDESVHTAPVTVPVPHDTRAASALVSMSEREGRSAAGRASERTSPVVPPPPAAPGVKPSAGRALLHKYSVASDGGPKSVSSPATAPAVETQPAAKLSEVSNAGNYVNYPRIRTPTPISMTSSASDSEGETAGARHVRYRQRARMRGTHAVAPATSKSAQDMASSSSDSETSEEASMCTPARLLRASLGVASMASVHHAAVPSRTTQHGRRRHTMRAGYTGLGSEETGGTNGSNVQVQKESSRVSPAASPVPSNPVPDRPQASLTATPTASPIASSAAARDESVPLVQLRTLQQNVSPAVQTRGGSGSIVPSSISRATSASGFSSLFGGSTVVGPAAAQASPATSHSKIAGLHASSGRRPVQNALDAAASYFESVDSSLLHQYAARVAGEAARLEHQQQILTARLSTAQAFHSGIDAGAANVLSLYGAPAPTPANASASSTRGHSTSQRGVLADTRHGVLPVNQTEAAVPSGLLASVPVVKPVPARFERSPVAETDDVRQHLQGIVEDLSRCYSVSDLGLCHSGSTVAHSDAGMHPASMSVHQPLAALLDTGRLSCRPIRACCGDELKTNVTLATNGDVQVSPGALQHDTYGTEIVIQPSQSLVHVLQRRHGTLEDNGRDTSRRPVAVVRLDRCMSATALAAGHSLDASTASLVKHMLKCSVAVVRNLRARTARVAILSHDCSAVMMDDAPMATLELTAHLDRVSHPLQRPLSSGTQASDVACRWRLRYSMRDEKLLVTDPTGKGYAAYVRPPAHVREHMERSQSAAAVPHSGTTRVYLEPSTLPACVLYLYTLAMTSLSRCVQLETKVIAAHSAENVSYAGSSSDGMSSSGGSRGFALALESGSSGSSSSCGVRAAPAPASVHELPSFLSTSSSSHWTSVSNRQAGMSKRVRCTEGAASSSSSSSSGVRYPLVLREDAYWLPDIAVTQLLKY